MLKGVLCGQHTFIYGKETMTPFYSRSRGQFVIDARCECGHAESEHGSQLRRAGKDLIRLDHDGSCCNGHCACRKFTWMEWITADSLVESEELCA